MTREEKNQFIDELSQKLSGSSTFYITDTMGLDALTTSNLRRACHKANVELKVVKNTLLKKALEKLDGNYSELYEVLAGPSALMFAEAGNAPAKVIKNFRKKSEKPIVKAAWIEESIYIGDENLEFLTTIKSKEELIGDIIALLQSPAKNVISGLQGSAGQKIAGLVKALAEKE